MSSVTFFFRSNKDQLIKDFSELKAKEQEVKETSQATGTQVQNNINEVANLIRDEDRFTKLANNNRAVLLSQVATLQADIASLEQRIANSDRRRRYARTLQQELEYKQQLLEDASTALTMEIEENTARLKTLKQNMHVVGISLSMATASLSLYYALSGNLQDQMISTMLAVATNSIQMAMAYTSFAMASGNLAMLSAITSAISGSASIISTMRSIGERSKAARDAQLRKMQNQLVG